jgi:hypothetical protein
MKFAKTGSLVALSAAVVLTTMSGAAQAQRRAAAVAAGVAVGVIAGAAIANSARASDGRVYVRERDCSEYRRNARYNEEIGRPSRAQYWWDRYEACRGN